MRRCKWDYSNNYDSEGLRLADCELPLPPTGAASQEFSGKIKDFSTDGRKYFAIETLDGVHVGRTNINSVDRRNGTFEIATLINKEHRGKGYGASSMKILLKFAFMENRLNKYCAFILEGNEGSVKMHEKLGCKLEGVLKQNFYTKGKYCDELCYGLLKDEFLEIE